MFTGIIEATAPILTKTPDTLVVARPKSFIDQKIGSSIAVSGACLSIVAFDAETMTFNVVEETWQKTKFGKLEEGSEVNLERALAANGRFEGHMVQGHVEGAGTVNGLRLTANGTATLEVRLPPDLIKNCVQKGSIALDGVSLTIAELGADTVSVALIPHTLQNTILGGLKAGDKVNVETDVLGRYVGKLLQVES